MANKNEVQDQGLVVEMADDQGNKYYYEEEMIVPVGDERYAILVGLHDEDEAEHHHCGCGCGCDEDDEDVLVAKIVVGEDGEDEYVEPTDEEFERFQEAYEALMDEAEAESEE